MYDVWGKRLRGFKSMYVDSSACVTVKGNESEQFRIDSRARKWCIMSPWLFNIYMVAVMKMGMEKRRNTEIRHYRSMKFKSKGVFGAYHVDRSGWLGLGPLCFSFSSFFSVFYSVLHPYERIRCPGWSRGFRPLCLDPFPFLHYCYLAFLCIFSWC